KTGRKVWHFQTVHHDLSDYDTPAAPLLLDITVGGRKIKALVQVTKQSFAYVLDRVTGKPVWPMEERPVPASAVPGEKASPTQLFPTRPPAFDRQGLSVDDLIDFTPELRAQAIELTRHFVTGPLFTPPSVVSADPNGPPLTKPPYGRITAIDLNRGEQAWMIPNGDGPRNHPLLKDLHLGPLGHSVRAAPLVTKTLLFVTEGDQINVRTPPGGGGRK